MAIKVFFLTDYLLNLMFVSDFPEASIKNKKLIFKSLCVFGPLRLWRTEGGADKCPLWQKICVNL
jgi:hypothetical protein